MAVVDDKFEPGVGLEETSEVYAWFWRDVSDRPVRDRLRRLARRSAAMSDTQPADVTYAGTAVSCADEAEWPPPPVPGSGEDGHGGHDHEGDSHEDMGEPTTRPDDLPWQISYDRASVDRFVAEVEAERARLQAAIAAARARVQHAKAAAAARQAQAREELGALVLAVQRELEEIERHHRGILEAIGAAAEEEVARLLTRAGEEAAAVRATAHSLAARVGTEGTSTASSADFDSSAARLVGNRSDDR